MTGSLITMSIVGLLAGFIFSMPIAGPVSILITTNALKGRFRFCNHVNIGASFATFTYVFFAVFSLSKLYRFYKPTIPYLFIFGSIFLLFIGYRIFKTKIDFEHFEGKRHINEKRKEKETRGFYTGIIINFLNPTLFFGWLTSTFLVLSFVTSLGFNTGGLNNSILKSVKESGAIDKINENGSVLSLNYSYITENHETENLSEKQTILPVNFHLLISIVYALSICIGSIIWFYILALSITRFRRYINFKYISVLIKSMGIVLCMVGLYFGYLAASLLLNLKT
jgi:threonine/homoserine/homoserine lactone efflux protein